MRRRKAFENYAHLYSVVRWKITKRHSNSFCKISVLSQSEFQLANSKKSKINIDDIQDYHALIQSQTRRGRRNENAASQSCKLRYLISSCIQAMLSWGITKNERRIVNFKCSFIKFNLPSDWSKNLTVIWQFSTPDTVILHIAHN